MNTIRTFQAHPSVEQPAQITRIKMCGVYVWTHLPTGRKYVGSSVNCERRKIQHERIIKKGDGCNFHREAAILGLDSFTYAVVEECPAEIRLEREKHWIETLDSVAPNGFNVTRDPTLYSTTYEWDEDRRAAQSVLAKSWQSTPEARAARSVQMKVIKNTPAARAANSAQAKARQSTPEARAAASVRAKAYWASPEAREAQSARSRAWLSTPEVREAQSVRIKAAKNTPEARAAASVQMKARWASPGFREAQSAQIKARAEARKLNSLVKQH